MRVLSMRPLLIASAAALLLGGPVSAAEQIIFSEDFSDATGTFVGSDSSEKYQPTYYFEAPADPQWVFFTGGNYLASSAKTALDAPAGNKALVLNDSPERALAFRHSIAVTAGHRYLLTFDHWGDNQPGTTDYSIQVKANSTLIGTVTRGYTTPGPGASASFTFLAPSSLLLLSFRDISAGAASGIIDNIVLTAMPEPGTYALLLAGIGLLGFAAHRRQK